MQREKMVFKAEGKLIDLCQGLDSDDSGSLNIEEFFDGYKNNDDFRQCLEIMHVTESDLCIGDNCNISKNGPLNLWLRHTIRHYQPHVFNYLKTF